MSRRPAPASAPATATTSAPATATVSDPDPQARPGSGALPEQAPRLIDGPADAPATLLLAHGAGAPMDSPFLSAIAAGLAERGWRVVRFEFPYMARWRLRGSGRAGAPDRLPKLLDAFRQQVALESGPAPNRSGSRPAPPPPPRARPLLIGGKSLGGRVASLLVDELADAGLVRGCLCLGYPFHPPGRPQQLRTEHLAALRAPTLILQGERDPFGRRGEVEGYDLAPAVELQWIPAADHGFSPTRASGLTEADNLAAAVAHMDRFSRATLAAAAAPVRLAAE